MNLHNEIKNDRSHSDHSVRNYFAYVFRQNWQHFIFYFIVMLLAIVIPTAICINSYNNTVTYPNVAEIDITEVVSSISIDILVNSIIIAVFAGMSAISYVNSKQAVGCFNSFPIERSSMYFIESSVKAIYYIICLVFSAGSSYIMLNSYARFDFSDNIIFFLTLVLSILSFCLIYAICLFSAGLTGTGVLRFLMFYFIIGLPALLYYFVCASVSAGMPSMDVNYYLNFNILKWICPPIFIATIAEAVLEIGDYDFVLYIAQYLKYIALLIIPTAGFYFGGLMLHIKRKSESSGTSIIWKPVFGIIKYSVIFVSTLLGGIVFREVTFDMRTLWYFLGATCGFVLSFLLSNIILYRSFKAMFYGLGKAAIMAVFCVVFIAVTVFDMFDMNRFLYSPSLTKEFTVTFDGTEIIYTDKDDIDELVPIFNELFTYSHDTAYTTSEYNTVKKSDLKPVDERTREALDKYMKYTEYAEKYYIEDSEASQYYSDTKSDDYYIHIDSGDIYNIEWVQKPSFGIPLAKNIHYSGYKEDVCRAIYEYIFESDEYCDKKNSALSRIKDAGKGTLSYSFSLFDLFEDSYPSERINNSIKYEKVENLYKSILEHYEFSNESRKNYPVVGSIQCKMNDYKWHKFDIYADDIATINLLADYFELGVHFNSADEVWEYIIEDMDAVFVLDVNNYDIVQLTDEDMEKLMPHISAAQHMYNMPVESAGKNYAVIIMCGYEDGYSVTENGEPEISYDMYFGKLRASANEALTEYFK